MSEYWYTKKDGSDGDRISPNGKLHIDKNVHELTENGRYASSYLEDPSTNDRNTPINTMEVMHAYNDKYMPTDEYPYGHVLSCRVIGCTQLFMPWPASNIHGDNIVAQPLYYRAITDSINGETHWTPWRRIAYYDEIESVVLSILKSKGLIT